MLVLLSSPDDAHVGFVEPHLNEPLVLLNSRDILEGHEFSYRLFGGKTEILKDGRILSNVKSVWYRRWMFIQDFELPVPPGMQSYAQKAIKQLNNLIFTQFADAFWVSDHFAIERANNKLLQLQVAANLGFNVPDTVFTSSEAEAKAFVAKHKPAVAKSNYSGAFESEGKMYAFYTSRINNATDFSGVRLAPPIIQAAIEPDIDVRVIVIGTKVFAASIKGKRKMDAQRRVRDWRAWPNEEEVEIRVLDLPQKIEKLCARHVKELGLQYGAIDLIRDKKGKYWFLENNPNGQWAFVEDETGQPIGKALAEMLMRGSK